MFFIYIIRDFQPNLMQILENLTWGNKNNVMLIEYQYIKCLRKYDHVCMQ